MIGILAWVFAPIAVAKESLIEGREGRGVRPVFIFVVKGVIGFDAVPHENDRARRDADVVRGVEDDGAVPQAECRKLGQNVANEMVYLAFAVLIP